MKCPKPDSEDSSSSPAIGLDGPPYIALEHIEVASWEVRTMLMNQLQSAMARYDFVLESVPSSKQNVLALQAKIKDTLIAIVKPKNEKQTFALQWIIGEVCVNSGVTHGNKENPALNICTAYGYDSQDGSALMYVKDEGPGFNPKQVPDPTATPERLMKPSGRGLLTTDKVQLPQLTGARGIYLPMQEGHDMCREFVLSIPLQ